MRTTRWLAVMTLAVTAGFSATGTAGDVPRYRLETGMELSYRFKSTFRHQDGKHINEIETTVWIVRRNADGSVRVVLRQGNRFTATLKSGFWQWLAELYSGSTRKEPAESPMEYNVGYCDLFPDGRIGPDAELGFHIYLPHLFPRLPDDSAQGKSGWGQMVAKWGQDWRYSELRTEPSGWTFLGETVGMENKIYGMTTRSTYHFDRAQGVIKKFDGSFTQDYGFRGKGSGSIELTRVSMHDATWLASFAPAADRYFAAIKSYEQAAERASKAGNGVESMLAEAKSALKSALATVDQPVFREQLDRQISQHDDLAKGEADSAKRIAGMIGKPAADWELTELDGMTHRLTEYRGKVVVLDFWYRGCGACIKAMPQLNALAKQFEGRPVVVLGMNTDAKEADAKFVRDAMGLKYPTLRAKGIPEKYGVEGFPTLILIDPQGIVRDVHIGYSPTLRGDLARAIEGLL